VDPSIRLTEDEMFALFKSVLLKRDVSDRKTVELLQKLYMAGVRKADDSARELFRLLDEAGVLKNSVVIITADHGDEFGEHGGLSHDGKMYSELVDVPLILYDPDLPAGRIVEPPVSTVDIPPTILHLFGLESVPQFFGHSLLPVEAYPAKGVFGETVDKYGEREKGDEFPIYYYREGDLKIIYRERNDQWEMYDLQKDPHEKENIVSLSPHAQDFISKLRPRVHRWS
jgi:arylsulfatase A-like enzyme